MFYFFFFKQKTAYEMRISDWSSDVCSSDLRLVGQDILPGAGSAPAAQLHYRDDNGQHVTLTMRAGGQAGQTSFTFARNGADPRFVWQHAQMAYSLVGTMEQENRQEIAEAGSLRSEAAPTELKSTIRHTYTI